MLDCDFRPRHAALEEKVKGLKEDVDQAQRDLREVFGELRKVSESLASAVAGLEGIRGEIRGAKWGGSAMSGFIGALIAGGLGIAAFALRGGK